MQFFRNIYYELKYLFEEIGLLFKHPSRKATYKDIWYHWCKLWDHIIFHPWYCLKRGIRNLFIWFPTIWGNDCWDHTYLTNLMDKQMKEMQDFFESGNTHLQKANQVGKRIKWTRKLYDMWIDEYYNMKFYHEYKEKYPNTSNKIFGESEPCAFDEYGIPTLFRCTHEESDEARDFYRNGSNIAHKKDEKVFKLYMKNLSRIREWWD